MRYAIYFVPPMNDPLNRVATNWLGRDVFSGRSVEAPAITGLTPAEIAFHTAAPRRYGFHGTLKSPFRLADGTTEKELLDALMHFADAVDPFEIPRLEIGSIGPFFALLTQAPVPELDALAASVVREFDAFRAPLTDSEIERRSPHKLTAPQLAYLHRWGYPYVFDEFRFHMTLTGPIDRAERERVEQALHTFFDPVLSEPVEVENVALFIEEEAGAPFEVHSLHPLGRFDRRRSA